MQIAKLEHANITVSDPKRSAAFFEKSCGWHIRWEGPSMNDGYTIHVGSETHYLALYTNDAAHGGFTKGQPLNHIAIQVTDLDLARQTVVDAALEPFNDGTYDPGPSTFYFYDWDGIEFEVVSYE
ncbi:VOC family protein [Pontixanthobacter sp.]|uniref:VOC family protein n=1 Tax=Pontixanthobacter sp. TaxID=2792078 RepID=UPI003C7ECB06